LFFLVFEKRELKILTIKMHAAMAHGEAPLVRQDLPVPQILACIHGNTCSSVHGKLMQELKLQDLAATQQHELRQQRVEVSRAYIEQLLSKHQLDRIPVFPLSLPSLQGNRVPVGGSYKRVQEHVSITHTAWSSLQQGDKGENNGLWGLPLWTSSSFALKLPLDRSSRAVLCIIHSKSITGKVNLAWDENNGRISKSCYSLKLIN
jgi:hypothetical protein